MAAKTYPVLNGVLTDQRRPLVLWGIALAAISGFYISVYPAMGGGAEMQSMIDGMPDGMVTALGYDQIGTPGGYISSTVYGLIAPILLLVFAITTGARLLAGQEEDGTLELELTAPVGRRRLLGERIAALWLNLLVLVVAVAVVTFAVVAALDLEVGATKILAGATGLLLLVLGFATIALAVGAITGRRGFALGAAAGLALVAYMLNAIGPTVDAEWMTALSPFAWYLENDPLTQGFDATGLLSLAVVPIVAAIAGVVGIGRRDLMV